MAKVYAMVPGAEVWIPPYGTATNDRPCLVPAAVAEELAHAEELRVEPDEPTVTVMDFGRGTPTILHGEEAVVALDGKVLGQAISRLRAGQKKE